jgi:hypothetical protein
LGLSDTTPCTERTEAFLALSKLPPVKRVAHF